ncbi:MAG: hypothetical protein COB90_00825, partial [Hyphomicrobiales bacterium]
MILGSAAALVAVSGAQAADLPVAEPVDYVRICDFDGWGTGIQIPGTETCLKIGGYVRTQIDYSAPLVASAERTEDHINFYAKGYLKFDAINDTEYGVLRSFIDFGATGGSDLSVGKAYIQFNGFTMGYVGSFFDNTTGAGFFDGPASDETNRVFAYTMSGGNGFSATLSLEDRDAREVAQGLAARVATEFVYGGKTAPDVVAAVGVSQGWGSLKATGVVKQLRSNSAAVGTAYGYAASIGATFNVGSDTTLNLGAAYADGAVGYVSYGAYDAAVVGTSIKKSKAWSAVAALTHAWSSTVSQDFHYGYGSFDAYGTDADSSIQRLSTRVTYSGITGLSVQGAMEWTNESYSMAGKKDVNTFATKLRV